MLSLGYNELAADLAWSRTLVYYGDGMERRVAMLDLESLLGVVNTLDPWFRRPYIWGAYALVVQPGKTTHEQYLASGRLLERGLEVFPDDWELAWRAGVRYAYDIKGGDEAETRKFKEHGIALIERAMRMPDAPSDLPLEAAELRTKIGQKERALKELREMILTTSNEGARKLLLKRYQDMVNLFARDELESAAREYLDEWRANAPFVTPSFYILLGKRPPEVFDLTGGPDAP